MSRPPTHARSGPGLGCAAALVTSLALGSACGGDDGSATGESSGSSTGLEPLPRPVFTEPASGQLMLSTTRTEDLVLHVDNVLPGRTELVIDDRSFGSLDEGAVAGQLDDEAMTLRLRGSMLVGTHEMFLRTPDPAGPNESGVVRVNVARELEVIPAASPTTAVELGARRLLALGYGADGLLAALDDGDPAQPRLHLLPRADDGSGWDLDGRRTLSVPGVALDPEGWVLPVAAVRRGRTHDDPGRLRVAWRVGTFDAGPGLRIDLVDVPWDEADPEVEPIASLSLEDALVGRAAEWAQLGRPWLMGELLLVELWAAADVESPRPGDRALVWSRLRHTDPSAPLVLDPVQRVTVGSRLVDLDRMGPALDRIAGDAGQPPVVTVRVDQIAPRVLEIDPVGGVRVRPTVLDGRDRSFSYADLPLCTVTGALGSRTVAGITPRASGRMRMAGLDDLGAGGIHDTSLGPDDLPPLDTVTAELAPSTVGGLSVFLVPYGDAAPVQAVYSNGSTVGVKGLDELRCEAVAVGEPPDPSGEAPLACARDGALELGTLAATPVP